MSSYLKSICFGFAPALQKTTSFPSLKVGAVNRSLNSFTGIGGKGANTARMIGQLGGECLLVGFYGGKNGERYLDLLSKESVENKHIHVSGETRLCHTLLQKDGQITELVEEMPLLKKSEVFLMEQEIETLDLSGIVSICGKLPKGCPDDFYAKISLLVKKQGGSAMIDTQGDPLIKALKFNPFIKINKEELFITTNKSDLFVAAEILLEEGANGLLVTDGKYPATLFLDGSIYMFHPPSISIKNSIGSGDAVMAGINFKLSRGCSVYDSVYFGIVCGVSNAMTSTCGHINTEDIKNLINDIEVKRI